MAKTKEEERLFSDYKELEAAVRFAPKGTTLRRGLEAMRDEAVNKICSYYEEKLGIERPETETKQTNSNIRRYD